MAMTDSLTGKLIVHAMIARNLISCRMEGQGDAAVGDSDIEPSSTGQTADDRPAVHGQAWAGRRPGSR